MRTTRFVMPAPFRAPRRSRGRRSTRDAGRVDRRRPPGDETGDREGHRQAVVVVALGSSPPVSAVGPSIVMSSPSTATRAAERARGRRRSRRSGPIPCAAARRRRGSSSVRGPGWRPGRGPGSRRSPRRPRRASTSIASSRLERTDRSASGSPVPVVGHLGRSSMPAPIRSSRSMTARRVGFMPDAPERQLGVRVDRPGDEPERGRGDVAPGPAGRSLARVHLPRGSRSPRPHRRPTPPAPPPRRAPGASARCDRGVAIASRTVVPPSARRPARRIADLTWALGTAVAVVDRLEPGATDHGQWRKGIVRGGHGAPRPSSAAVR